MPATRPNMRKKIGALLKPKPEEPDPVREAMDKAADDADIPEQVAMPQKGADGAASGKAQRAATVYGAAEKGVMDADAAKANVESYFDPEFFTPEYEGSEDFEIPRDQRRNEAMARAGGEAETWQPAGDPWSYTRYIDAAGNPYIVTENKARGVSAEARPGDGFYEAIMATKDGGAPPPPAAAGAEPGAVEPAVAEGPELGPEEAPAGEALRRSALRRSALVRSALVRSASAQAEEGAAEEIDEQRVLENLEPARPYASPDAALRAGIPASDARAARAAGAPAVDDRPLLDERGVPQRLPNVPAAVAGRAVAGDRPAVRAATPESLIGDPALQAAVEEHAEGGAAAEPFLGRQHGVPQRLPNVPASHAVRSLSGDSATPRSSAAARETAAATGQTVVAEFEKAHGRPPRDMNELMRYFRTGQVQGEVTS